MTRHGDVQASRPSRFSIFSNVAWNLKSIPLLMRDLEQPVADLLVIAAQDHVAAVDQGHVRAELVEDAGEFVGDIAAAGDHDPLRQLVEVEHLVRGDAMLGAGMSGIDGRRAGRDQDVLGGDLACRSPSVTLVRAGDRRALVDDLDLVVARASSV